MSTQGRRAISIGAYFADERVTNATFRSNATLLDKDVALLALTGLATTYPRDLVNPEYLGLPNLSESGSARIRRDIERRRSEIERFLKLGRTLYLLVPAPEEWYAATGQENWSGTGRNARKTSIVSKMGVLGVLPFSISTEISETDQLELRTSGPFADFWRAHGDNFSALAHLAGPVGTAALVIRGTDHPVAGFASVGSGTVVLLPGHCALAGGEDWVRDEHPETDLPEDVVLWNGLFDLANGLAGGVAELPDWTDSYALAGEADLAAKLEKAEESLARALKRTDAARANLETLRQRKLLVTGSGAPLERAAAAALKGLGFSVGDGHPGRTDRVLRTRGGTAVAEIKGKAKSAAEADAAQLEKWVSEFIEEHGEAPKGILIVNAWRNRPVAERTQPTFPDQMLPYAERREHCLITGAQLLAAWMDAEASPRRKGAIRRSILECVGRYEAYDDLASFTVIQEASPVDEADDESRRTG